MGAQTRKASLSYPWTLATWQKLHYGSFFFFFFERRNEKLQPERGEAEDSVRSV